MAASLHFLVTGSVQGVGFRAFTIREAKKEGLVGWCKNVRGGGVEGVVQGDSKAVTNFKSTLLKGPGNVEGVKVKNEGEVNQLEYNDFVQKK